MTSLKSANSLSSDPLLSSLNLFKTNRKSSPLMMMSNIGGGLLVELLSNMHRRYSVPNNKRKTPTTTIATIGNQELNTSLNNNNTTHNNTNNISSTTSLPNEQQQPKLKSLNTAPSKKNKDLEEIKKESESFQLKLKEEQFMLTSVHEIDAYLIKNKFQVSKEEAIHEFFKMMKYVLAYAEITEFQASKKMVAMVYSISKNVLKIIGNNHQSLKDVYNLLCMVQFKNFKSLQIPCYQLAYGFKVLNDMEFSQSLFENHISFIIETSLKSKQNYYCDYLMSAYLLLPMFSVTHEHLVDKILEFTAHAIPKGALGSTSDEVHEKFGKGCRILPSAHSYGLFSCIRSFSEQIFDYMTSIERKTLKNGKFDSELFINSVRKIYEKGVHMDIHKYNFALEILVRNNSSKTLSFFHEIRRMEHLKPDTGTYCTLIKYYGKRLIENDEETLMTIYDEIMKQNLANQHLLTTFLSITKRHNERYELLRERVTNDLKNMDNLDSHSITELLHQSVLRGGLTAGYNYFCELRETAKSNGITLSSSAYNIILHAVSNDLQQVTLAFTILNYMLEDKVHPSDFILVSLLAVETKLRGLLYKPGEVDPVIVERLERYKLTLDQLLKDIIDDACQGKQVNYVIISAAMKRFKATQEYEKVIKIWKAIRSKLPFKTKLDGSIYLLSLSCCEKSGDFKTFNESIEFIMNENLPRISWQLYYYLVSTLVSQKDVKLGDNSLYERLISYIYTHFTPHFCNIEQTQRITQQLKEDRWASPPPSIMMKEISFMELARKIQSSSQSI